MESEEVMSAKFNSLMASILRSKAEAKDQTIKELLAITMSLLREANYLYRQTWELEQEKR